MKRWNGWGDEAITYPLPASAAQYLEGQLGPGLALVDADFLSLLGQVEKSRLAAHRLISTNNDERLRHARGQSLPDWIALRSGQVGAFPDGVAYPNSDEDVRVLLAFARQGNVKVIPYGGGTSVVGHINPIADDGPTLTLDMTRLNRLLGIDETSWLAYFEAGITGPEIERKLNERGYTLGHFPQSFEFSTLGGWIATRSSGQQSYHYGRIENLFAGGHVETPIGDIDLPPLPASAAGPDLRQVILGSEGRLGVVTRATMRVQRLPEVEAFYGVFFHDWQRGVEAVREMTQAGVCVSMLRLSNAVETATTLALSGKDALVKWAGRGLRLAGFQKERSLLVFGITGSRRQARQTRQEALEVIRAYGGLMTGAAIGKMWQKSRFYSPYLRNSLWEAGYALDTIETAIPWTNVISAALEVQEVIQGALLDRGEKVLVFAHLSHVYRDGASIYVTYLYRRAEDPLETLQRWQIIKCAASRVILTHGGTISHQHGVGLDHAAYLAEEKGPLGIKTLETLCSQFDPGRNMNPGKLLLDNY
jgi:alkyldihydroxyacetonephosphate synthase